MAIKDELDSIYEYTLARAYDEGWDDRDAQDIARDTVKAYFERVF